jgi:SHS family lactate transporter-like MFS transporter
MRARLLAFTLLATVFDGAELTLLAYFFPSLAHDFHVSVPAVVAVNTLQGLASLAGGLLFGPVGDRYGRRTTLLVTVFLYGAATLVGAFVHGLALFTLTRVVAGLGLGGEFGAAFAVFNELWPQAGRGILGAAVQNMFVVGIVLTTLVGYLSVHATAGNPQAWRWAYAVVGAATLVVWLAVLFFMPESPLWREYAAERRAGHLHGDLAVSGAPWRLFQGASAVRTLVATLVSTGIFYINYSLVLYEPTLLARVHHLPPGAVTDVLVLGYVALFCGSLAAGAVSDLRGRRLALMAFSLVALVGYGLYALTWRGTAATDPWRWPLFWVLLLINFGCGAIGVVGVWLGELYPTRLRATAENLIYYAGRGLGGSVLPLLAILLVGGAVGPALGLGGAGAVLAAASGAALAETRGRTIQALE